MKKSAEYCLPKSLDPYSGVVELLFGIIEVAVRSATHSVVGISPSEDGFIYVVAIDVVPEKPFIRVITLLNHPPDIIV